MHRAAGVTLLHNPANSPAVGKNAADSTIHDAGLKKHCRSKVKVNVPQLKVKSLVVNGRSLNASFAIRGSVDPIFQFSAGAVADMRNVSLTLTDVTGSAFLEVRCAGIKSSDACSDLPML